MTMSVKEMMLAVKGKYGNCALVQELTLTDELAVWPDPAYRRIDAVLCSGKERVAIEAKRTVADFRRETPEKRRVWEEVTHKFVYLTPQGLLKPEDIPAHCGLWEVNGHGQVYIVKRAKVRKEVKPIPFQIILALMYRSQPDYAQWQREVTAERLAPVRAAAKLASANIIDPSKALKELI